MMRIALAIAGLAAMICLDAAPSQAQIYGHAPWCAVTEAGAGEVQRDCEYYSIQECTPNVIAGNRGFCQMNPYYVAEPGPVVRHRPYRRRYHRYD